MTLGKTVLRRERQQLREKKIKATSPNYQKPP